MPPNRGANYGSISSEVLEPDGVIECGHDDAGESIPGVDGDDVHVGHDDERVAPRPTKPPPPPQSSLPPPLPQQSSLQRGRFPPPPPPRKCTSFNDSAALQRPPRPPPSAPRRTPRRSPPPPRGPRRSPPPPSSSLRRHSETGSAPLSLGMTAMPQTAAAPRGAPQASKPPLTSPTGSALRTTPAKKYHRRSSSQQSACSSVFSEEGAGSRVSRGVSFDTHASVATYESEMSAADMWAGGKGDENDEEGAALSDDRDDDESSYDFSDEDSTVSDLDDDYDEDCSMRVQQDERDEDEIINAREKRRSKSKRKSGSGGRPPPLSIETVGTSSSTASAVGRIVRVPIKEEGNKEHSLSSLSKRSRASRHKTTATATGMTTTTQQLNLRQFLIFVGIIATPFLSLKGMLALIERSQRGGGAGTGAGDVAVVDGSDVGDGGNGGKTDGGSFDAAEGDGTITMPDEDASDADQKRRWRRR